MLPGISAEDCLFADLGLNPGENGCQSFEATDFLGRRRRFDPSTALVLWQVGVIGEGSVRKGMSGRPERLQRLVAMLEKYYSPDHSVVLYEAAQYPLCDPMIKHRRLGKLARAKIMPMTTLYIPPKPGRRVHKTVAGWLAQ
jgi:hypothetical protein